MNLEKLGVIPSKEAQFNTKGIETAEDLTAYIPKKYKDYSKETGILEDENSCIRAKVESVKTFSNKMLIIQAICKVIPTGEKLLVTWFNQFYLLKQIESCKGQQVYIAGKISYDDRFRSYTMSNPEIFESDISKGKKIHAIYPKIKGMSNEYLQEKIRKAFDYSESTKEVLPSDIVSRLGLETRRNALYYLHFPKSQDGIEMGRKRLIYDDLIYFALQSEWASRNISSGSPYNIKTLKLLNDVKESLEYKLTDDQEKTINEMLEKVRNGKRLYSLVQGDVGCGKTIVAILLMCAFVGSGYQTVIMTPTKVLARQHYEELKKIIEPFGYEVAYLGAELKAKEKKEVCEKIRNGSVKFVVGTHSVIGKDVEYNNLALTITDEEHKFGVMQKKALIEKAREGVHAITMSATPIPKSLAQVVYGEDLTLHTIKTMPNGRQPIKTGISKGRNGIYKFIKQEIENGRQIYVVCPLIDKKEYKEVKSVEETSEEYEKALTPYGIKIATLTGKDTKEETERVIGGFKNGDIDILISTTVIEVGINVPNATVMVITNAERFGLSQLHQLRGRVGRGNRQSYCILECDMKTENAKERMSAMCETTDGFEIAKKDLEIRGAGDFVGKRQSGENKYITLMLAYPEWYEKSKEVAKEMIDKGMKCTLLERAIDGDETEEA